MEHWKTLGEQVYLLTDDTEQANNGQIIDCDTHIFRQARQWLQLCEVNHKSCSNPQRHAHEFALLTQLRVVDVIENRIVHISRERKCVALSYVWGDSKPPKLYQDELARLSRKDSLVDMKAEMTRTIQDVMMLVEGLKLRYLWLDSLCLVQDDPIDLENGIRTMDQIFESAWVTIVAAEGPSADSGLPGVSEFPRVLQQDFVYVKPALGLLRARSLDLHLNKTIYASRGWT